MPLTQGQTETKRCRYRYDHATGQVVEAAIWEGPPPPRRAPTVIGDTHEPFRSMADGKVYDSKSRYRAELKARDMVELGNDMPKGPAPPDEREIERDVAEAYERVEAGQKADPLPSKFPEHWSPE